MKNERKADNQLNPEINIYITFKSVSLAAILGFLGYFGLGGGSVSADGQEVSRHDFMTLQHDVKELKVNMKVFSTMMTEENRKLIERKQ